MSTLWEDPVEVGGRCTLPGIYRFTIEGDGVYVGRFTHASRPLKEYRRNVEKLLSGQPYRPAKPDGFRRIHRALHQAVLDRRVVVVEIVENAAPECLNERERFWIAQIPLHLRLNGRPK